MPGRSKKKTRRLPGLAVAAVLAVLPLGAAPQAASLDPASFVTPEFLASHALAPINAQYAYARGYTGKGVLIAIVDSGLDVDHPEFAGRISSQLRNFFATPDPTDVADVRPNGRVEGHGTHVAGLAAAARDGRGMHGVAYDATLLPLRAIGSQAVSMASWRAIDHAIQSGAQVLNGSYGPPAIPAMALYDPENDEWYANPNYRVMDSLFMPPGNYALQHQILKAAADADIVMVYAAGNEFDDQPIASRIPSGVPMLPLVTPANTASREYYFFVEGTPDLDADNPNTWVEIDPADPRVASLDFSDLQGAIMAVVAVDRNGTISSYSNRCGAAAAWCLAAPGGDFVTPGYSSAESRILSTIPYSTYSGKFGTSMASPVAAGAAAVMREAFPYMTARQIIEVMLTTADGSGQWADRSVYGHGMLDLGKAVRGPAEFGADGFPQVFDVDTQGHDSEWSNDIAGSGGLVKRGAGVLTLAGANVYAGGTDILGGKLVVNGSVVSDLRVGRDGVLGGSGRVGNTLVWGRVAPGNSPGTLTVQGDYTQFAGSVLEIELSAAASDRLDVTGTADIRGGGLQVTGLTADALGKDFTFLRAGSIAAGSAFDTSGLTRAFIGLTPVFGPPGLANSIQMQVRRNGTRFADLAASGNQRAAADAVESQGVGGRIHDPVVLMRDAGEVPGVLDQLSGEVYASTQSALIDVGGLVRQASLARLYQAGGSAGEPLRPVRDGADGRHAAWIQALGSWGKIGASQDAGGTTRSTGGIILGGDMRIGDHAWTGLAAGFTNSTFGSVGDSRARTDGYHLVAYAGLRQGGWTLRGGVSQSWYDISTRRYVAFSGFGKASSGRHARATQLFIEAGHALPMGGSAALEPYAGLTRTWLRSNGFHESGAGAALTGSADSYSVSFSTLGVRGALQLADAGRHAVQLTGGLGWRHAFGNLAPGARLQFASGNAYEVSGSPLARDALTAELGVSLVAGRGRFSLGYAGQFAGRTQDHGVQARALWVF